MCTSKEEGESIIDSEITKAFFNTNCRHPLQELCVSPFVPNDACLDLEHGKIKILTGPNASGKSVYLKQVS